MPNITELADKLKITRAMLYRNIKALKDHGLLEAGDSVYQFTDAGKVARL